MKFVATTTRMSLFRRGGASVTLAVPCRPFCRRRRFLVLCPLWRIAVCIVVHTRRATTQCWSPLSQHQRTMFWEQVSVSFELHRTHRGPRPCGPEPRQMSSVCEGTPRECFSTTTQCHVLSFEPQAHLFRDLTGVLWQNAGSLVADFTEEWSRCVSLVSLLPLSITKSYVKILSVLLRDISLE